MTCACPYGSDLQSECLSTQKQLLTTAQTLATGADVYG